MNIFLETLVVIQNSFRAIKHYAFANKIISVIFLVIVVGGSWYVYAKAHTAIAQTRYVLGLVERGTIVSVVSASGQVSASNSLDIKPKVSGQILWVGVKAGDTVKAGQALMTIDDTTARQDVVNAQLDLAQEELTLKQDTAQAPIDYQKSIDAVAQAQLDLSNSYDSVYTALSNAYATLPGIMSSAHDLLYANSISTSYNNLGVYQNYFINSDSIFQTPIKLSATRATNDYDAALASYNDSYAEYKALTRTSPTSDVEKVLTHTNASLKLISQALGSDVNLIDTTIHLLTQLNLPIANSVVTQQTTAHTQLTSANSVLSSVGSQVTSLQSSKTALTTAEQNLQIASIGNKTGEQPFSLLMEQNNVAKQKAALSTAQQALADHTVRAPFSGVIASVTAKVADTASSGSAAMTLITPQQVATLSLNEVDAAKISLGQKATLTFDAVSDLSLTGTVAELDPQGTVSQGVVSYNIKIQFDTQDARVKPGMTINANIQTGVHADVLVVPQSAVKTQNGQSYVVVFTPPLASSTVAGAGINGVVSEVVPQNVPVEVGLSDDTNSEIISGLSEGEQIVARTIAGTAAAAATRTTTTGARGFGGGNAIRL